MDDGEYQNRLRQDCCDTARRCGFAFEAVSGNNSASRQVAQIYTHLNKPPGDRPTVMIVSPVRETAILAAAYSAARLGIGFVVLLRASEYLNDLRREFPSLPIFAVLCDQREIGRIQGRYFRALLPEGGESYTFAVRSVRRPRAGGSKESKKSRKAYRSSSMA